MRAAHRAMKPLNGFAARAFELVRKTRVRVWHGFRPLAGEAFKGNELMRTRLALEVVTSEPHKPPLNEPMKTEQ